MSEKNKLIEIASGDLNTLIAAIDSKHRLAKKPFVIAIDGKSGVGKSTIGEQLAHQYHAPLITGDDFYIGGAEIRNEPLPTLADACIERAYLRQTILSLLAQGSAEYRAFDWDAFDGSVYPKEVSTETSDIILLEGVYTNHPDLRDIIDLSVLITASLPTIQKRLLKREGELGAWEEQWIAAEDWYFEYLSPPDSFDLVCNND